MIDKDQILSNLDIIETTIQAFNGIEIIESIEYLGQIVSLQTLATETQASAKYGLLQAINDELDRQATKARDLKIPPSIAKLRADGMCREWHYIYEKSQRYSSNITHTIDACRTKISYHKQELENSKFS